MRNLIRILSVAAAISTVGLAIVSAQPWGDNSTGYVGLIIFIAWAISAYVYMYFSAAWIPGFPRLMVFRTVVASLLCISGVAIIFDTVFIHIDAQGGLVFLFIPLYQWVILGLQEFGLRIISKNVSNTGAQI